MLGGFDTDHGVWWLMGLSCVHSFMIGFQQYAWRLREGSQKPALVFGSYFMLFSSVCISDSIHASLTAIFQCSSLLQVLEILCKWRRACLQLFCSEIFGLLHSFHSFSKSCSNSSVAMQCPVTSPAGKSHWIVKPKTDYQWTPYHKYVDVNEMILNHLYISMENLRVSVWLKMVEPSKWLPSKCQLGWISCFLGSGILSYYSHVIMSCYVFQHSIHSILHRPILTANRSSFFESWHPAISAAFDNIFRSFAGQATRKAGDSIKQCVNTCISIV